MRSFAFLFVFKDEAEKLCKIIKKPEDISDKTLSLKSDILADKMSFCFTNLFFINDTLEYIKKRLNLLFESNGKYYPSSVLSTLKDCLKKTEEYNILKLKHAQKKFEQSKELKDFMYGKRNPKLAHLLSLDSSVPVDSVTPSKLMTPFGPVWIKRSSSDKSRMIYLIYLNQQYSKDLKYDEMCEQLDLYDDEYEQKHDQDGLIKLFSGKLEYSMDDMIHTINVIIKYINQPLSESQNYYGTNDMPSPDHLFDTIKYKLAISKNLNPKQKEAAAFLCGVLLLSESHEFRNPTGGKFERKAIENVLHLAENGCVNPFSKVFSNAKGRYIPAQAKQTHNQGNQLDNPLPGGQRIASMIIDSSSINVRFLCAKSEYTQKSFSKFRNKAETDYTNEAEKILSKKTCDDNNNLWKKKQQLFKSAKKDGIMGKTTKEKLGNDLVMDPDVIECYKGFGFINWLKNAKENDTFDINQLPDIPKESIISQIKTLVKGKNRKRLNKLLSNMI